MNCLYLVLEDFQKCKDIIFFQGVFVYKRKKSVGRKSNSPTKGSPSKIRKQEQNDKKGYANEPWYPAYKRTVMSLDSQVEVK